MVFASYSWGNCSDQRGWDLKTVTGYDACQRNAEIARKSGPEGRVAGSMQAASRGTPTRSCAGSRRTRKLIGDFELNVAFRFGGMPYEVSDRGLELFVKEALPASRRRRQPRREQPLSE